MIIDNQTVAAGEKRRLSFALYETVTGVRSTPVTVCRGHADGPTMLVLAGCHPGEYNGIVAAIRFANRLDPATVRGAVIIVHAQNLSGLDARSGHLSTIDGVNMGRAFPVPGAAAEGAGNVSHLADSPTHRAARRIFETFVPLCDYVVDLHGGEYFETLPPNVEYLLTGNDAVDDATRAFAASFGIELLWEVPNGSIPEMPTYPGRGSIALEAGYLGKPGVFFEVGGEGKIEWNFVDLTVAGLERSARVVGILDGEVEPVACRTLVGGHVLFAGRGGFCDYQVEPGQEVAEGERLGVIFDFTGETVEEFTAPSRAVLTNVGTKGAVNPGDMLFVMGNVVA